MNRRRLMESVVGAMVCIGLPGRSVHASVTNALFSREDLEDGPLHATRLSDSMIAIAGAGGNIVAANSTDGIVMVDGGVAHRSDEVLDLVRSELGGDRIHTLFNTHWHSGSVGSNKAVRAAGGRIVAHENTRLWLTAEISRPWEEVVHAPLPKDAQPNETFYTSEQFTVGNRQVRSAYMLQAHTDGDAYVAFPDENVLVTGGVVSAAGWPLIDWWTGGWILGMVDGLDRLIEASDERTRIVPGNGPLLRRTDLVAQRDMYLTIYERLIQLFLAGKSPAEAVEAAPTREFDANWGDPAEFITLAFQSFWPQFTPNV